MQFKYSVFLYYNKINRVIDKNLTYDLNKRIIQIIWNVYNIDGTLGATMTDIISYVGASPIESTRSRTVVYT